jgi:hypothetical protein
LELAQCLAYRCDAVDLARCFVEPLCESSFPVHAIVSKALRGQWEREQVLSTEYLRAAAKCASDIGLDGIAAFCENLLTQPYAARTGTEFIFP